MTTAVERSSIEEFIQPGKREPYAEQYQPHQMLVIKDFLPASYVMANYLPEVEACTKYIHRVKVGSFKKSGSVSPQSN